MLHSRARLLYRSVWAVDTEQSSGIWFIGSTRHAFIPARRARRLQRPLPRFSYEWRPPFRCKQQKTKTRTSPYHTIQARRAKPRKEALHHHRHTM